MSDVFKPVERDFYEAFDIVPSIREWRQFNYAQVPRGLEIYERAKEQEELGNIIIKCRKLTPTPDNDCVYWEEWYYANTTFDKICKLICLHNRVSSNHRYDVGCVDDLLCDILRKLIDDLAKLSEDTPKEELQLYKDVRLLYKCPVDGDTRKDLEDIISPKVE